MCIRDRITTSALQLRQRHPALAHIFARAVSIARLARLIAFEEEELACAFIGVNLCRQRRGVGKFQRHMAFPARLKRGDIHDDAAARIGRFAKADHQHIFGHAEIFHRARQCEGIGRDDANIRLAVDEVFGIELFGIDDGAVDIGEDFELWRDPRVIAV